AEFVSKALSRRDDISEFYDVLATLYSSEGNFDQALEVLDKGLAKFPKDERLYFSRGIVHDKQGDFEASMKAMRKVLDLNPQHAAALNYIGYSYAEKEIHLDEALQMVSQAATLKPKDGYIQDSLGWVYFKRGDPVRALHHLLKADELSPNEPTILER